MISIKNLLNSHDLTKKDLLEIIELGNAIYKSPADFSHSADGKLLGTLFFEPSTRTRLSFESAMLRLGGSVVGFSDASVSSAKKGESLQDTVKTVSQYADIIAMRHPQEGAAYLASLAADCPIINAGDGGHQHPTQTLTDMLTISNYKEGFDNHVIGICGDLKYGRTVHSLIKILNLFEGNKYILISPEELKLPQYVKEEVFDENSQYEEVRSLDEVIDKIDILYMTRIQRERFYSDAQYTRLKDSYLLDKEKMERARKDMIVLHPLPRVNEIAKEVDDDPRAVYFKQAKFGMYVRMALIIKLLEANND
ncbi:aspartate carbamoyltransferase [Anaerococcus lactolyticus]|uniref:Aspartate carbamoyltransferase n=1 Tax=Anaerococcus lactolyticus S7-1-13 TaxID=1284686 RepID=A0A095X028_9FIRM|nr:aspartate carbamoyltransferase [Anaerococcus lactolyticus]KGF03071.1 aspartate carbamoyltransferase catalytic subunit [Anaerococcus lactolyticus S7-1-13]